MIVKRVNKEWGYELWIVNNDLYCGKLLFNNGLWSSGGLFHYHPIKHETFFVIDGALELDVVGSRGRYTYNHILSAFKEPITILPFQKHRFRSKLKGGCKFLEFSTTHRDEDSIRCFYDKLSQRWIDKTNIVKLSKNDKKDTIS